MSLTIENEKFTIFGSGYEQTRNDSGDGGISILNRYGMGVNTACFDKTGRYLWFACYGNGHASGLFKVDLSNGFTEIQHGVPTDSSWCTILHAPTDDNNLGLCMQGSNWYVFDLTDDEVVASGTASGMPTGASASGFDVALKGTKFYFTNFSSSRTTPSVTALDYDQNTYGTTVLSQYQRCGFPFITNESIYMYYPAEWQYHSDYIEAVTPSGTQIWGAQGSQLFSNVQLNGFGANGKLYVPSLVNSKWRLGEYDGTTAPDFNTPSPIRTIGEFESKPTISGFQFSHEKERVAFSSNLGVFVSDFNSLRLASATSYAILAVSPKYLVFDMGYLDPYHPSSIGVLRYS